jgi:hypothetical protein
MQGYLALSYEPVFPGKKRQRCGMSMSNVIAWIAAARKDPKPRSVLR